MKLPPPRGRGRGGSEGWMGLVTPSDFSTRLPIYSLLKLELVPVDSFGQCGSSCECVCVVVWACFLVCYRSSMWGPKSCVFVCYVFSV